MVGIMQMNRRGIFAAAALAAISLLTGCEEVSIKTEAKELVEYAKAPTWVTQTVATMEDSGKFSSIALYADQPRIAFYQNVGGIGYVRYAVLVSIDAWDATGFIADGSFSALNADFVLAVNLEVDSGDNAFASFTTDANKVYFRSKLFGEAWSTGVSKDSDFCKSIGHTGTSTPFPFFAFGDLGGASGKAILWRGGEVPDTEDITLAAEGKRAVSRLVSGVAHTIFGMSTSTPYNLTYRTGTSSLGTVENVALTTSIMIPCFDLAVDAATRPRAAFIRGPEGIGPYSLHSSLRSTGGSNWTEETIVDPCGPICAIAARPAALGGGYVIAYLDTANHVCIAYQSGGTWTIEVADSSTIAGTSQISVAVDSQDRIHLSFYDSINKDLKYAVRKHL
jgi:hypothetical protein